MSTIYYLQWHTTESEQHCEASDLFHEFHIDPPDTLTESEFDELYEEVAETDTYDLEMIWRGWNRGSGYETREFVEQRTRSMSVGDIVERENEYYTCVPIGWQKIDVLEGDARS